MRIFAAEVLIPQIVVSVELDKGDGAVFFGDRAENGEADGVIAADTNATDAGCEKRSDSLLDADESVLDGKRIHREIAEIGDAIFGEGIDSKDGVPRTDDGGLRADISRPEARAGTVGGAAIERDADEGYLELGGLGDVRKAHEGGDAGETGKGEGIERLGMWQAKGAAGCGHGEAY